MVWPWQISACVLVVQHLQLFVMQMDTPKCQGDSHVRTQYAHNTHTYTHTPLSVTTCDGEGPFQLLPECWFAEEMQREEGRELLLAL